MARMDTSGLQDIIVALRKAGAETGEMAQEMVMAGAEEIKKGWQQAILSHGLVDSGQMLASVGYPKKPTVKNGVAEIDVYPQGKDKRGVRNAEKAFIQHYGSSRVKPTRFVDDAERNSADAAVESARAVFDKKMKEAGL